jgi:hypothetical protein
MHGGQQLIARVALEHVAQNAKESASASRMPGSAAKLAGKSIRPKYNSRRLD